MRTKRTKIYSLVLALLICLTAVFANTSTSQATEKEYDNLLEAEGTSVANTEISYNFTVDTNTNTYLYLYVLAVVNCEISVYDSAGNLYGDSVIYSTDWYWYEDGGYYYYELTCDNMPSGDYSAKLMFDADLQYTFGVDADKVLATISDTSATLSVGFTKKLKVDNTSGTVTWSSSKASVATVSDKGVVTAKKAGTATITAKTESGLKLTCKITVKANTFKETKMTTNDFYYGDCGLQVYSSSYAANGDLVLKCRFVNYSGYKVNALKNLKITFKTDEGKTIGTYSAKSMSLSVSHGSTKDFTLTIKKAKLKIKKADLRNASYTSDGSYQYTYYY